MNPSGQKFLQRELKTEYVRDCLHSYYGNKDTFNQHGCKVSSGKPLNWIIISSIEIAKKSRKTAKKAINISKYPEIF